MEAQRNNLEASTPDRGIDHDKGAGASVKASSSSGWERVRRRFLRRVVLLMAVVLAGVGLAAAAGWSLLRASLPQLEGSRTVAGLGAPVTVERDAAGIPTIHAGDREDLFRALGFLHAQDRFFQMDLLRRQGAGELSELVGPAALPMDREFRQHGFRHRAAAVLAAMPADQLRALDAYVQGVNSGLAALGARPWEYFALRSSPRPWTREDCVLVVDAMSMTLESDGSEERSRLAIAQTYGEETLNFLRPLITARSAALDDSSAPAPPIPAAENFVPHPLAPGTTAPTSELAAISQPATDLAGDALLAGSNSFALAGSRTRGGGALVANDPHLHLGVPNIWYRTSLVLPGGTATGVTLPGVPALVIGSNGHVAWSFTNSYIDTCDVVIVETNPADPGRYRVPDGSGWERFENVRETIAVHGQHSEVLEVPMTRWGPLITKTNPGAPLYARHYSEYDPAGISLDLIDLMDAQDIGTAIAVAHRSGIHPQNFIVGDSQGNVVWTIIGRVPKRVGTDWHQPQSWADGANRWDGFLAAEDVPVIRNPPAGQLWTANNRVVGGAMLTLLGDAGYDGPNRSGQIRDRLMELNGRAAVPADLLAVQLDDEACYLAKWRELLATVLDRDNKPQVAELLRVWDGHASVDSVAYRLLREFRRLVLAAVFDPIMDPVQKRDPVARIGLSAEQPLWSILSARPAYLLPKKYASWDDLLFHAAGEAANLGERHKPHSIPLAQCAWGEYNVLAMRHPLSAVLPAFVGRWLDMPAQSLPGDSNMPRVQAPAFGASMRMIVSPGREGEGIFEQPGGASGHPLSRFYRAGHNDWTSGQASPFLPGPAAHRLELQP